MARTVNLPGSALIAPSFIRNVATGGHLFRAACFTSDSQDRAVRVMLLASMYPDWPARRVMALAEAPGVWRVTDTEAVFTPAEPDTFFAEWDGGAPAQPAGPPDTADVLAAMRRALDRLDAATKALDDFGRLRPRNGRHIDLIEDERTAERVVIEAVRRLVGGAS